MLVWFRFLALIIIFASQAKMFNPVTPFNYCADKDGHCM